MQYNSLITRHIPSKGSYLVGSNELLVYISYQVVYNGTIICAVMVGGGWYIKEYQLSISGAPFTNMD